MNQAQKDAMKHENKLGEGANKRKKLKPHEKFAVVMAEFHKGTLHSSDGKIVKDRDQAIAIALSEAAAHGAK